MLLRPYLVAAGVVAAVALTAAPAVASSAPSTTDTPAPATTSPAPAKGSAPIEIRGPEGVCFVVEKDQQGVRVVKKVAQKSKQSTAECLRALKSELPVTVPQGAPETGGGGMAAEVGSWN